MTDHPIPDDLVEQLALTALHAGEPTMLPEDRETLFLDAYRQITEKVLAALAEWADGAPIDPRTWRRLDAREVCHGSWHGDDVGSSWVCVPQQGLWVREGEDVDAG